MTHIQQRIAELRAQGLEPHVIRERLGLTKGQMAGLVNRMKEKEKASG